MTVLDSSTCAVAQLLTRKEVARQLGTCAKTVQRMGSDGRLRVVMLGGRVVRYYAEDVAGLIRSGTVSTSQLGGAQ